MLQRTARQWQVSDATAAVVHAKSHEPAVLSQWLCVDRQLLLPCQQDDIDGSLLSGRTGTGRPE